MKIITDALQGSPEWLQLHIGRVTASEASNILTPQFKIRDGETPHSYLCKKVAEKVRNKPLPSFGSWQMEQGISKEDQARAHFAFSTDNRVTQVDFCQSDDGRSGCSPDGLIGDDSGLEIKCPEDQTCVKYLLGGVLPPEYAVQVHFSLFVTGRPTWNFYCWSPIIPPLRVVVERDEEKCDQIAKALAIFAEKFDQAMERIKRLS